MIPESEIRDRCQAFYEKSFDTQPTPDPLSRQFWNLGIFQAIESELDVHDFIHYLLLEVKEDIDSTDFDAWDAHDVGMAVLLAEPEQLAVALTQVLQEHAP